MCARARVLNEIIHRKHLEQSGIQQEHNKCLSSVLA